MPGIIISVTFFTPLTLTANMQFIYYFWCIKLDPNVKDFWTAAYYFYHEISLTLSIVNTRIFELQSWIKQLEIMSKVVCNSNGSINSMCIHPPLPPLPPPPAFVRHFFTFPSPRYGWAFAKKGRPGGGALSKTTMVSTCEREMTKRRTCTVREKVLAV